MTRELDVMQQARATDERRATNARIAKEVMGWPEWDTKADWKGPEGVTFFAAWGDCSLAVYDDGCEDVTRHFDPATKIADAFLVVEAMRVKGWRFRCEQQSSGGWWVCFWDYTWTPSEHTAAAGDSLARAICKAALDVLDATHSPNPHGVLPFNDLAAHAPAEAQFPQPSTPRDTTRRDTDDQ